MPWEQFAMGALPAGARIVHSMEALSDFSPSSNR